MEFQGHQQSQELGHLPFWLCAYLPLSIYRSVMTLFWRLVGTLFCVVDSQMQACSSIKEVLRSSRIGSVSWWPAFLKSITSLIWSIDAQSAPERKVGLDRSEILGVNTVSIIVAIKMGHYWEDYTILLKNRSMMTFSLRVSAVLRSSERSTVELQLSIEGMLWDLVNSRSARGHDYSRPSLHWLGEDSTWATDLWWLLSATVLLIRVLE